MNISTEETVPTYSNLGLTATSICNYKVGLVSWVPGESPPDHYENCETPFGFFHSQFVDHSTKDKLPMMFVKLQGNN